MSFVRVFDIHANLRFSYGYKRKEDESELELVEKSKPVKRDMLTTSEKLKRLIHLNYMKDERLRSYAYDSSFDKLFIKETRKGSSITPKARSGSNSSEKMKTKNSFTKQTAASVLLSPTRNKNTLLNFKS